MQRFLVLLLLVLPFAGCGTDDPEPTKNTDPVQTGKQRFTTVIDGDTREYYVHVPSAYDGTAARPMVIMLHGTSGDGEKYYNISGWKEVGEAENLLTVFPSSWRYTVIDDGRTLNTTKWNVYPGAFEYAAGEVPRDDIAFLRRIIAEMTARYAVDEKRIYLLGFSNGGQMAFRCAVEMSDVLAAVVENAGSTTDAEIRPSPRDIPVIFQLGNEDEKFFASPFPLSSFETLLRSVPFFQRLITSHAGTFHYATDFTVSGDTGSVVIASFAPNPPAAARSFHIVFVKGLAHNYPNGSNHWLRGAERHWEWLRQYALP